MNRREFLAATAAAAAASASSTLLPAGAQSIVNAGAPANPDPYIEQVPVPEYSHASPAAYEAFQDMKFGARIHWGIYSHLASRRRVLALSLHVVSGSPAAITPSIRPGIPRASMRTVGWTLSGKAA